MAEVGLVRCAQVAREVAETVLPTSRSKYAKHVFAQPSLLAIVCLMRYEDWTFREAEVRLGEHQDLGTALGVERVPDDTTRYRFLRRLDSDVVTHAAWGGRGAPAARHNRRHGRRRRCDRLGPHRRQSLLRGSEAQAGHAADPPTPPRHGARSSIWHGRPQ